MVYRQPPPEHVTYIARDLTVETVDRSLKAREAAMKMMKFYLHRVQDRMKKLADKKRSTSFI